MAQLRDLIVTGAARFVNGAYFGGASTFGSATRPVWWNNGFPQATTYSLSATLNAGSANRLAYYSGANAVSASSHYASATQVGINITNIDTIGSRALYVNGTSQFSDDIYANKSIRNLAVGGGLYWNPYVESATDNSDVASITLIKSGVAGGTELQIKQANDQNDVINLVAPYYIYLNNKRAFTVNDSWLRINDTSTFTSGIYTGTSILRTDNQLQVGDAGANFYAKNSGDVFIQKTLGINGVNIGYKLYVNGISWFSNTVYFNNANYYVDGSGNARFNTVGINGANTDYGLYVNKTSCLTNTLYLHAPIYQNGGYNCSGGGEYLYYKICTIKITASHINRPVVFEISGRGRHFSTLEIIYQNINNADPALTSFTTNWDNCYYIIKTATGTWEVYGAYSEAWGRAVIHRVTGAGSNIGVTINMENVSALPSGYTQVSYGYNSNYAVSASRWTTARTFTIGNTGKTVDGTVSVSWSIAEIGAAPASHTHGLLHSNFNKQIDNTTTDSGWSMINSSYSGFILMSLRTQANAPAWILGDYAAGVAFGGADTKGVLSVSYSTPRVRFAGGNGSAPRWNITLKGTSDITYNLDTMLTTANYTSTLDGRYVNVTGDTMTGALNFANGTWNKAGDDAQFGDNNTAGSFAIQGINGNTNLKMVTYGNTTYGTITWNGSQFVFSNTITGTLNGNAATATAATYVKDRTNGIATYLNYGASGIASSSWYCAWNGYEVRAISPANLATHLATSTLDARYVNVSGDTMTGQLNVYTTLYDVSPGNAAIQIREVGCSGTSSTHDVAHSPRLGFHWGNRYWGQIAFFNGEFQFRASNVNSYTVARASAFWGAVWNDYAECRQTETEEPGYVFYETGQDDLKKTIERLQHFAGVSSDTWGFSQGETKKAKTPIAVAGRVLVYPYRDRNEYKPGDCVCAAPGGTVDIMTREEIIKYPDRIVGTVSCVPEYETWGGNESADRTPVKVNGRIWIKVK